MCGRPSVVSAWMQLPSADSDWLMLFASSSVVPAAPVRSTRSDPAKSTRLSWLTLLEPSGSDCVRWMTRTQWLRLECSFMFVRDTWRHFDPARMMWNTSASHVANSAEMPSTHTPRRAFSRMRRLPLAGLSRSRTRSLYISRKLTLMAYSVESSSGASRMRRNMCATQRGTTPRVSVSGFQGRPLAPCSPYMVNVLPLPVCPYAKIVLL
mmetsp:Transcript_19825/g.70137  ORF Transcript_19825/g.70137 Transcript_19825/m.70137 type:complete len:209 (+) Transcript_19825:341-967(+)